MTGLQAASPNIVALCEITNSGLAADYRGLLDCNLSSVEASPGPMSFLVAGTQGDREHMVSARFDG